MSEAKGQHEPSMEEILASIRRIIAEDGEPAAEPPPEEKPAVARQEEILELTDVVEEDGTVVNLNAGKPAVEPPAPRPPPIDEAPPPPRTFTEPEPPPPPPKPQPMPQDSADRLVSGATAAASVAAFSQLGALGRERQDIALGDLGRTLEDVIRELLRPLLKDWLDAHLPQLVERLVQEEIQRMVREAQGR